MDSNAIATSITQLFGRMKNGSMNMNHPLQREFDQWTEEQKRLLIDSILRGMVVPPAYIQKVYTDEPDKKHKGKFKTLDVVIDAKQRLTSIFSYLNDEFSLSEDFDPVIINDEEVEIAGKKFSELDMAAQYKITEFRLPCYYIEDATDEEIEECISRLNNSTPFTKTQKAKTVIGYDLATLINDLSKRDFFTKLSAFSPAQRKGEMEKCTIIQTMMIFDWLNGEYSPKSISEAEVLEYSKNIKGKYTDEKKKALTDCVDYLEKSIEKKNKFLKKVNVPMVIYTAKLAIENNIDCEDFGRWLKQFAESDVPGSKYSQYRNSSTKLANTKARIDIMEEDFRWYFSIKSSNNTTTETAE